MMDKPRVFLSYGHDEYAAFANGLKQDLEKNGFAVWFDLDRLRPGGDWEQYIEEGLRWLVQSPTRGRVVLLMTPHSVRRPDGYCLNEIARALELRLTIVPVMVRTCEPPLSICRIQWLDMRDTVADDDRETSRYNAKLQKLIDAIEGDVLNFEGGQARLTYVLNPLPFEGEFDFHLERFVGREWLLDNFDGWINSDEGSRVLWISGPPGIGKTAIACWLAVNRPEVSALHLCRHDHVEKGDPRRMVMSIAFQLASQLPVYAERLQLLPLEEIVATRDDRTLFDRLLVQPLSGSFPKPHGRRLIIIDALDEVARGAQDAAIAIWSSEFLKTPSWLRLVVTSRADAAMENAFGGFANERLDATFEQNRRDIIAFVEIQLRQRLAKTRNAAAAVQSIVDRSEGIFLYAAQVVREINEGHLSLDHPDQLPRGVAGIVQSLFTRQFPDEDYYGSAVRPILEAIAAAMEPLPLELLGQMFDQDEHEIHAFATSLGGLFSLVGGRLQPFHKVVVEWCTDRTRAGRFFVSVNSGHSHLAESGWREYERGAEAMSDYALNYLPLHLLNAGERDRLIMLLTDFWFAMVKSRRRSADALLSDYDRACSEIEATGATTDLGTWRTFLRERLHILRRADSSWPADRILLQLAVEHADLSPVTRTAEAVLASGKCDWVWLRSVRRESAPARNPCLRIFEGHQTGRVNNDIYGFMLASNGTIVSWASDCTIRIWDLESGRCIHVLEAHGSGVRRVEELEDGRLLAWSEDSVTLWQSKDGRLLAQEFLDEGTTQALHLGGGRLLCGGADGVVRIVDIVNGGSIAKFFGHTGRIDGLRILSDGRLLTWAGDHTLCIHPLDGGEPEVLEGHENGITAAIEAPDGSIVSGSFDQTLRVWRLDSPFPPTVLRGHTGSLMGIEFLSNGLLLSRGDQTLRLWDLQDNSCVAVMRGHRETVLGAKELPNRRLLTWGFDYTLRLWDLDSGRPLSVTAFGERATGHGPNAHLLSNGRVATLAGNGDVRVWDVDVGELVDTFIGHTDSCTGLLELGEDRFLTKSADNTLRLWATGTATTPSDDRQMDVTGGISLPDERLLCWSAEGEMELWNEQNAQLELAFCGHADAVVGVLPSDDGRFVSWSDDGTLRLWNADGRSLKRLSGHEKGVIGALWLDNERLLSWGRDCRLRIWEMHFGSCVTELEGHLSGMLGFLPHKVAGAVVLQGGQEVVSWGTDSTVRVWNLLSGELRATLGAHTQPVTGVLQCDHSGLLSWGSDGDLYIWNLTDETFRHRLRGHEDGVQGAALLENGKCVSWSLDGTIRVWDRSSGICLAILRAPDERLPDDVFGNHVDHVAVLKDGTLIGWYQDGRVRRWDVQAGRLLESIAKAEVFRTRPEWIAARMEWTCTQDDYVAWTNGRRLGISSKTRDGVCAALWDGDADLRVIHLDSSGVVATAPYGRPVRFLALYHGNRRIGISELKALLPRRAPVQRATTSLDQPPETPKRKSRRQEGWVRFLDSSPEMLAEGFTKRGFDLAKSGDSVRALADFDQAIRLQSERWDALFYRGHVYYGLENLDRALEDLDRAVELAPDIVPVRCLRAQVLLMTGQLKKALNDLDAALQIDQSEAVSHKADAMREFILSRLQ